ncbi:hypothetical protein Tco_0766627 [Tanacetum coccineum]
MDYYLYTNDQISWGCFQAFHCDAIMGQMLYQFQGNQQDYFSNDTFRGRSCVSSTLYYEVTPPDILPLRHAFLEVLHSNPLFDADNEISSSDDESISDEDVPKEIYSNSLFDEEIISTKIDPHHFNVESDLIESLLNRDTLIISSPKFDSLLEEFSGELAHIDLIPPGINEGDFDPEEDIRLVERLLYDNSFPRPPEEFNSKNFDAIIESFSPSPIPADCIVLYT